LIIITGVDWRPETLLLVEMEKSDPLTLRIFYLNGPKKYLNYRDGLTKGVSSTHALKTLFSLPVRCPNKREQNSPKDVS
jgi:hypothetical protein